MPYRLSLRSIAHQGTTYRVNGRDKMDKHVFQRDPQKHGEHVLMVPDKDWAAMQKDIFFEGQTAVIYVDHIVEPDELLRATMAPLHAALDEAAAKLLAKGDENTGLQAELDRTRLELTAAQASKGGGLSDDERAMLRTFDTMLDLLRPVAQEGEAGPVEVLERLTGQKAPAPTPAVASDLASPGSTTDGGQKTEAAKAPLDPAPDRPKVYNSQGLGKMARAKLESIAGGFGIPAAHELKPVTTLIAKILEAQAKAQEAAAQATAT